MASMTEAVDHPAHYGGEDDPYETIKVIEAWGLGFHLGNAVKYIARAGKKNPDKAGEDLDKAVWYIQRFLETEFEKLKQEHREFPCSHGGGRRCPGENPCAGACANWAAIAQNLRSECRKLVDEETRKRGTGVFK